MTDSPIRPPAPEMPVPPASGGKTKALETQLTKELRTIRRRVHRWLNRFAGEEPGDVVHLNLQAVERYFTERGLPDMADTRMVLGFCLGRLMGNDGKYNVPAEVVLEYVAACLEIIERAKAPVRDSMDLEGGQT